MDRREFLIKASAVAASLPFSGCASIRGANEAGLILRNGSIHTLDARNSIVSSIALKDGKVLGVGADADHRRLRPAPEWTVPSRKHSACGLRKKLIDRRIYMKPTFAPAPVRTLAIAGKEAQFPANRIFRAGRDHAAHAREMGGAVAGLGEVLVRVVA